ncbi:MAG: hypothetical protein JNM11_07810 [Chitinimonas sp.]|nr:hypothetical protein [Chitinimonas sp.]
MSFSSHRRKLLDETLPFSHRASHARSCALHVANKLGLAREAIIERVAQQSGVSLHRPENGAQLLAALAVLESMRQTAELPDA